jgi:hypothetical protein
MPVAFWITAAVTLLSAGVSFGFSVGTVRRGNGAARASALYTLAPPTSARSSSPP